jgi:hypothetical protein
MTTTVTPIRVLIADEDAMVRSCLTACLAASDDLQLVGEAADGADAVRGCGEPGQTSCSWNWSCPVWTARRPFMQFAAPTPTSRSSRWQASRKKIWCSVPWRQARSPTLLKGLLALPWVQGPGLSAG